MNIALWFFRVCVVVVVGGGGGGSSRCDSFRMMIVTGWL